MPETLYDDIQVAIVLAQAILEAAELRVVLNHSLYIILT